jgi:hypothetical protein
MIQFIIESRCLQVKNNNPGENASFKLADYREEKSHLWKISKN